MLGFLAPLFVAVCGAVAAAWWRCAAWDVDRRDYTKFDSEAGFAPWLSLIVWGGAIIGLLLGIILTKMCNRLRFLSAR
jgi:hypothetical protein